MKKRGIALLLVLTLIMPSGIQAFASETLELPEMIQEEALKGIIQTEAVEQDVWKDAEELEVDIELASGFSSKEASNYYHLIGMKENQLFQMHFETSEESKMVVRIELLDENNQVLRQMENENETLIVENLERTEVKMKITYQSGELSSYQLFVTKQNHEEVATEEKTTQEDKENRTEEEVNSGSSENGIEEIERESSEIDMSIAQVSRVQLNSKQVVIYPNKGGEK